MSKQRRYSAEFKLDAVSRMEHCETITGLAKELGIRRKFLYQWRDQLQAGGKAALDQKLIPASAVLIEQQDGLARRAPPRAQP